MTAPLWTSAAAAAATGGQATRDFTATGLSIDTRSLQPGEMFVALKDVRDGHEFVAEALAKGAAAAMVSRVPDGLRDDAPLLLVPEVLPALEDLARAARCRTDARVIGVTGSAGKTSTKEMLRAILSAQGHVHAAEASFNNHWGVPLTLARMPAGTDFAVIEIGMNHPGEIAPLARLARLHAALITTVAPAHLAAFDNIEGIAREKASILDGLEPGGIAVLPADLPTTPILTDRAAAQGARQILFGKAEAAEFRLIDVTLARDTTVVQATAQGQPLLFKVQSAGQHFAMNGLGALAVARALGVDLAEAVLGLGQWRPPAGRGMRERIVLDLVDDHLSFDLIDDAYNANPASMSAALDVLGAAEVSDGVGRVTRGRRVAVLGDMLELGHDEAALHAAIARHPMIAAIDRVHCVGPLMRHLWNALPREKRGEWAKDASDMAARAHTLADAGDVLLVKGSKSSRVSLVVDAIRKLRQGSPDLTEGPL